MEKELHHALAKTAAEMNRSGLNQGRSGNVSVRCDEGLLISASGARLDQLDAEDIVFCTLDGQHRGPRRPSSELSFHSAIYRSRSDVTAVVHVHSPWATSIACMGRSIPPYHYMVAVAGGHDIPCVPYAVFGSEALAQHVVEGLHERNACLLANHGQVAVGDSLDAALELALEVENLARGLGQLLPIAEPQLLSEQEMNEVLHRFRGYGRNVRKGAE